MCNNIYQDIMIDIMIIMIIEDINRPLSQGSKPNSCEVLKDEQSIIQSIFLI